MSSGGWMQALQGLGGGGISPGFQEQAATQGIMNWGAGSIQRSWGSKSTRHAREFAERVMRNQIQWMVKDLQKAGLNPVLAVGKGPGSAPNINAGTPSLEAPDVARLASSAKGTAAAASEREHLALQNRILADQAREAKVRADNAPVRQQAEIGNLFQEQALLEERARQAWAERNESVARTQHLGFQNQLLGLAMPGRQYDARIENSAYGKMLKWVKPTTDAASDLSGAVGGFLLGRGTRAGREAAASSAREINDRGGLSPRATRALQEMREMAE